MITTFNASTQQILSGMYSQQASLLDSKPYLMIVLTTKGIALIFQVDTGLLKRVCLLYGIHSSVSFMAAVITWQARATRAFAHG